MSRKALQRCVRKDRVSPMAWAVAAYKAEAPDEVDCTDPALPTPKVAADSQFEAVLGKTHRTEF